MTTQEPTPLLLDGVRLVAVPDESRRVSEPDNPIALTVGMTGAVVYVHNGGEAFEVEFVGPNGAPLWLGTLYPHEIELWRRHEA